MFKKNPVKRKKKPKYLLNKGNKCKNDFCDRFAKAKGFCMRCYINEQKKLY